MRIKIGKISSENLMYISIVILIILTCFPMTMCLPSVIRYSLQVVAMVLFFIGLAMTRSSNMVFLFSAIVIVMLIRVYITWQFKRTFASCAFSVYASWAFAFYGFWLYRTQKADRCKKLFNLLFIIIGVTAITSIIGIQRYPLVVRELGRAGKSYSGVRGSEFSLMKWEYRLSNIAGWNQLYGMVFLIPSYIYAYLKTRKKGIIISAIIVELCVILSQLTFAMLLSLVLIVFSFLKPSKKRNWLALQLLLLLAGIVVAFNLDTIILLLVRIVSHANMTMLANKLYDLYLLLQGVNSGDALSRTSVYSLSIELFKQHPLLGQALHGVNSPYMFSYHSDFLDMIAYYGLFGVSLVLIGIAKYFKLISKTDAPKWITFILFVGFLSMYIFNPVWYSPQIFLGVFLMPAVLANMFREAEISEDFQGELT